MGLCKCPKKKVTNLFCFEHRVNVCEHCLVSNHPKCIVQSYLQWLQDSDYDPNCRLCGQNLGDGDVECVRLACYDVFHWPCVDKYARTLPANTAPAGYTCPTCKTGIFPASNVVSPVAESLRKTLSLVNWARAGLGLPLIEEESVISDVATATAAHSAPVKSQNIPQSQALEKQQQQQQQLHHNNQFHSSQGAGDNPRAPPAYSHNPQSIVNVDDSTPYSRGTEKITEYNPRKLFDTTGGDGHGHSHDHDDDKYKRRPAFQWFMRWFRSNASQRKKPDPNAALKRMAIILILCLLGFMTLVVILTRVGRASADRDPFLDPMANPNIRVAGD